MIDIPPGKTPISYLQELCSKRGTTPLYDLLANEGAVHEPMYIMRVTVADINASGTGPSKKKAKHAAAQMALDLMLSTSNGLSSPGGDASSTNCISPHQSVANRDSAGNPVGELQELTQKKFMKPPLYEFSVELGPPHAREFICTVKLGKIQEKGSARGKKAAKRVAAQNMLNHIHSLVNDEGNAVIEEEEDDDIPLKFFQSLRRKSSKQLKTLQEKPLNAPATNYCQMLQEIAETQRFEMLYTDIPELSAYGMHQCLIQLSTMPVAVCHGTGPTVDDAHANAAHHALQYLKLTTKT